MPKKALLFPHNLSPLHHTLTHSSTFDNTHPPPHHHTHHLTLHQQSPPITTTTSIIDIHQARSQQHPPHQQLHQQPTITMAGPNKNRPLNERPINSSGQTSGSSKAQSSASPPSHSSVKRVLAADGFDGSRDHSPRPSSRPSSVHGSAPGSPRMAPSSPGAPSTHASSQPASVAPSRGVTMVRARLLIHKGMRYTADH